MKNIIDWIRNAFQNIVDFFKKYYDIVMNHEHKLYILSAIGLVIFLLIVFIVRLVIKSKAKKVKGEIIVSNDNETLVSPIIIEENNQEVALFVDGEDENVVVGKKENEEKEVESSLEEEPTIKHEKEVEPSLEKPTVKDEKEVEPFLEEEPTVKEEKEVESSLEDMVTIKEEKEVEPSSEEEPTVKEEKKKAPAALKTVTAKKKVVDSKKPVAKKETAKKDTVVAAKKEVVKKDTVVAAKKEVVKKEPVKKDTVVAAKKEAEKKEPVKKETGTATKKEAVKNDTVKKETAPIAKKETLKKEPVKKETAPKEKKSDTSEEQVEKKPKWVITRKSLTDFVLCLHKATGDVILTSESYANIAGARLGVDTLKKNIALGKFQIHNDKSDQFFYKLKDSSNKLLAIGSACKTIKSCNNSIQTTKKLSLSAELLKDVIDDMSYSKYIPKEELITDNIKEAYRGKWIISKFETEYQAKLIASNGEVLLVTERYASINSVQNAIKMIVFNAKENNFIIDRTKGKKYFYRLRNDLKTTLCIGENYPTKVSCINSIESVKRFCLTAEVEIE